MSTKMIEGFGVVTLNQDDEAEMPINVSMFDKNYNISLLFRLRNDGDLNSITQEMLSVARNYLNNINNCLNEAVELLKKYYNSEVKERASDGFCDYTEIQLNSDLSKIVEPEQIYIKDVNYGEGIVKVFLGLIFKCDWNEDGFVIKYDESGNVIDLGTTDIIY